MLKSIRTFLVILLLSVLFCLCVSAQDGVVMYDFENDNLGWTSTNATNVSFDGESYVFTASSSNPVLSISFPTGSFKMNDYRYIVIKAKSTVTPYIKPYIMLRDKNGNKLYSDIWSGNGAAISSQFMKKDFHVHVFDMTALGSYTEPYISQINFGVGLYSTGNTCHVDYIAFYTEQALYKNISFDKNTSDDVTGIPENQKAINGEDYTLEKAFVPKRDGYYFVGWSQSKEGDVIESIKNVTQNVTLYAIWQKDDRISITYKANAFDDRVTDMPLYRVQKLKAGEVLLPKTIPHRKGFTFRGWSITQDGRNMVQNGFVANENTVLYAIWSKPEFEWDLSNGQPFGYGDVTGADQKQLADGIEYTVTSNDPMVYIDNISIPTNTYKKLHVVAKVTLPEGKTSTLKFYAKVDGIALAESRTAKIECTTTDNYVDYTIDLGAKDFWNNANTCTQLRFDPTDNCMGAVVAVQKIYFELPEGTVSFNANGAQGEMSPAYVSGDYKIPECTFTRDGYEFVGYTDGVYTYNVGDNVSVTSPLMLYALWQPSGGFECSTEIFYPGYTKKAIILSYDDGPVADEILIKKLNASGMVGAFNLVAGRGYYTEQKKEYYRKLYAGHEIGNHTWSHPDMREGKGTNGTTLTSEECYAELRDAKLFLEEYFGVPVKGLAYSMTNPNRDDVNKYVSERYLYARNAPTVGKLTEFAIPESFSPSWDFTCIDQNNGIDYSTDCLERYFSLETGELTQLSIWGHPENTETNNRWDLTDYMIKLYTQSGQNIWNPTVSDYVEYINATRSLVITQNEIYNPSDVNVYAEIDGVPITLKANSIYDGNTFKSLQSFDCENNIAAVTFAVDLSLKTQNALVVVACYDNDGIICGVKMLNAPAGEVTYFEKQIDTDKKAVSAAVYIFNENYTVMAEKIQLK